MEYESFFVGVGATILGTLVGVILAPRLMYPMQKKLLEQQLEFQEKMADLDLIQREKIAKEQNKIAEATSSILHNISAHSAIVSDKAKLAPIKYPSRRP